MPRVSTFPRESSPHPHVEYFASCTCGWSRASTNWYVISGAAEVHGLLHRLQRRRQEVLDVAVA